MVNRGTVAGILGLVSLVVPIEVVYYSSIRGNLDWTVITVRIFNGRAFVFNVTQFQLADAVLYILVLLTVLVGAILLLALRARPKIGVALVAMGVVLYIIDLAYDEIAYQHFGTPIPLGFFLMLAAAIVGLTAKPRRPTASVAPLQTESSTDRLIKLKGLRDSGAITEEEYEDQKKKILEAT